MSAYAPVDDMEGKSPAELLREIAWTRRQRNDAIAAREAHAKARGEAEHRRSKAERSLADARRSFRGALDALNLPRTITTAEDLDALPNGTVLMGGWATYQRVFGVWVTLGGPSTVDVELPATVLYTPEALR